MKKIVLLASIVALTALMLAAAPAFADDNKDNGPCDHPGKGEPPFCNDEENFCNDNGDDNGDDDDNDCEINDINDIDSRLINRLNNVGNLEVSPTFEASQETEQDCDSGDVSQPVSVTGGGDNSIQTVGVNPSANTGCSQTALGVLDFNPTLGVQGGDFAFNADQFNVIQDNDCDGVDDDGDGRHDEDNFNCDNNGDDNGDDDNGDDNDNNGNDVNISDRDNFRFGGDRLFVNGGGGGDEFDFDDIGSSITMGDGGDTIGGGTINQAASAASTQVFPKVFV